MRSIRGMTYSRQSCLRAALVSLFLLSISGPVLGEALTAFPGAEGAGKWTVGGRGGKILFVTNLKDSGFGSLRAAVEARGRRTVVFRVAGTIWLKSALRVRNPYLTLAGQSAPGEGITVAGNEFHIQASEVIVRYMRFRLGDRVRADIDAVTVSSGKNIILDHLSASWGVDETLSVTPDARDVTVQWCLISESLLHSVHSSGGAHGKGSLLRGHNGARLSFHHNLYAHHADRAPMIAGTKPIAKDAVGVWFDFRNNVIYDWGSAKEGWEAAGANRNPEAVAQVNFINNAYLTGPSTAKGWLPTSHAPYYAHRYWAFEELSPYSCAYWAGNTLDGALWKNASGNADPMWLVSLPRSINPATYLLPAPVTFANAELPAVSASTSTASVLALVGASLRR
ncbi:MAG: pectate lyase, partial [Verrucomicrobiaceae bacterium]|nr:pectate lyase [Verrucomicrobiaceae bacterium]